MKLHVFYIYSILESQRAEAATTGVLHKKMLLKLSQNSQKNTCATVFFLKKLQAEAYNLISENIKLYLILSLTWSLGDCFCLSDEWYAVLRKFKKCVTPYLRCLNLKFFKLFLQKLSPKRVMQKACSEKFTGIHLCWSRLS